MAIRNVIFDLGGVMINYNPAAFIRDMGYDEETCQAVLNAIFYDPVWEDMDMGKYMTYTDALPEFIKRHPDLETPIREFFQPDWMEVYTVKEETERELYDWVHEKGLKIYILSNYAADGFTYISNKYPFFKKSSGHVVSAFEKCMKPDPEIYRILLERFNLKPEECVFIDDFPKNIEAARKAGMNGIVFTDVKSAKEGLLKLGVY